jgi:hypothetical protein
MDEQYFVLSEIIPLTASNGNNTHYMSLNGDSFNKNREKEKCGSQQWTTPTNLLSINKYKRGY